MKGAGLSAAFGGMHDRKDTTNERTVGGEPVCSLVVSFRSRSPAEPGPQPRAF